MVISNYEGPKKEGHRNKASPVMAIEAMRCAPAIAPGRVFCLLSTGAVPARPTKMRDRIFRLVRQDKPVKVVEAAMVKAVRDVSYQAARRATIGTSVMSGNVGPVGGFDVNNHVPGKTTVHEASNFM